MTCEMYILHIDEECHVYMCGNCGTIGFWKPKFCRGCGSEVESFQDEGPSLDYAVGFDEGYQAKEEEYDGF